MNNTRKECSTEHGHNQNISALTLWALIKEIQPGLP